MRLRRDRRAESFYARRATSGTYASVGGAAVRTLLFDVLQSDRTDGKILFVPDSQFRFIAKESETWCFQLIVSLAAASAYPDYIVPYLLTTSPPSGYNHPLALLTAAASTNNYCVGGELVIPLAAGESVQAAINSTNAANNNPSTACIFSGYRVS